MSDLQHVYLTAHGIYSNTVWSAEEFQIGLRIALCEVASAPSAGSTFTIPTHGAVSEVFSTTTGTHGTLTQGWEASLNTADPFDAINDVVQVELAEEVWTFLDSIKSYLYNGARWTHVKIHAIDAQGHSAAGASIYTFSSAIVGTGTGLLAPQTALAVTLRAPVLGRRGRGRFYLPALSQTVGTSEGILVSGVKTALGPQVKTFIDALQNPTGPTVWMPVVMLTSAGKPTAIRPTQIRIGDKFDTIRSRRAQVDEVYAETTL